MKITVTTVSTSLTSLAATAGAAIAAVLNRNEPSKQFQVQNLGTNDIYVDRYYAAAVATGVKIPPNQTFGITAENANELYFIGDGGNNTEIRVIVN